MVWSFLAPFLAERLIIEKPLDHADVIIVLAGSAAFVERAQKAALIYREGVAPKVFLTDEGTNAGWSNKERRNPPYVELTKRELVAGGVPGDVIEILSPKGSGTIIEAKLLGKRAAESNWKSLLIVTSPFHTRRALRTFETVFAKSGVGTEIGVVSPRPGQQSPPASHWWLTWEGWRVVGGEYIKSVFYHLNYY
jgi:uncharacterized SAM-binding protein YcdF (DUF218 family)